MRSYNAGFTLLELMIVVGIIAILASIAVPVFNEHKAMAREMSAQADAKNMISVLISAKD